MPGRLPGMARSASRKEVGAGEISVPVLDDDEGDGLFGGDLVALAGAPACWDGRHSGLVRYFGRVFGNQGTVERGLDEDPGGYAVDKRGSIPERTPRRLRELPRPSGRGRLPRRK